jgi:nucleoporin NDC1
MGHRKLVSLETSSFIEVVPPIGLNFKMFLMQRPLFYGLKMGLLPSGKRALKVSLQAFCLSIVLSLFLPRQFRIGGSIGSQILTQISIFIMTAGVSLCLEISHHFVQVSSLRSE